MFTFAGGSGDLMKKLMSKETHWPQNLENEGQSQDGRSRKEGSCEWGCRPHDILTKGSMPEPDRKATLGLLEVSDPCRDGLPPTLARPEGTTAGLGEAGGG